MYFVDFVATDPTTQSVVVAHQGTDPEKLLSIANDADIKQVAMNSTLFPSAAGTPACTSASLIPSLTYVSLVSGYLGP